MELQQFHTERVGEGVLHYWEVATVSWPILLQPVVLVDFEEDLEDLK